MSSPQQDTWLDEIRWNEDGLVTAITQDHKTDRVLTLAWMNRESLLLTVDEQRAVYWSRSRQRIWRKGEESGHIQQLKTLCLDCDGDSILMKVEQIGEIACHTGRESCFFRELKNKQWRTIDKVIKKPEEIYKHK